MPKLLKVLGALDGDPCFRMMESELLLRRMEQELHHRVIIRTKRLDAGSNAIRRYVRGLADPNRLIGSSFSAQRAWGKQSL